jgi:hypothetical protein
MDNPVMMNDPSGAAPEGGDGATPTGVWYWDKNGGKDLKFDKEHNFSNFPSDKGSPVGNDHSIAWDNLRVSRHYKPDGTTEDTPYGEPVAKTPSKGTAAVVREKVEPIKPLALKPVKSVPARDNSSPVPATVEVPEESTLAKAGEFALEFVPFSGVIDVYKGMKSGDKWAVGLGLAAG